MDFTVLLNVHAYKHCEFNKVKTFFKKVLRNTGYVVDDGYFSSSSFPVQIDNVNIRVEVRRDIDLLFQPFVCFYDHQQISKTLILEEFNQKRLRNRCKFDDTPLLFVGIKDEDQSNEINSESQLQKPSVTFFEWCVNASEQDTRKIFQEIVRMAVIKTFSHTVYHLLENSCFFQDQDQQKFFETQVTASWQLDWESFLSVTILRYLDLIRVAISYSALDFQFEFKCGVVNVLYIGGSALWNSSQWFHLKKLCCSILNDLYPIHTYQLPFSSPSHPVSILLSNRESYSINETLKIQEMDTFVRSLVVRSCSGTLSLSELLLQLKSLRHLVIEDTATNVKNLTFPTQFCETLKHLVLVSCKLTEVPQAVGSLIRLTVLNISKNGIKTLPKSLGNLGELRIFLYELCPLEFPPKNVLKRSTQDVINYLKAVSCVTKHNALQYDGESVSHNESKLIVAGQEGVGKSTLLKGMKRNIWATNVKPPGKTDGVEIQTLQLEETRFLVYDLAGDVEYLNTHPLFMSSECLHLVVFDLSQIFVGKGARSVDQLCRLELWLQMIASQHPKSYVIIVGTHADHERVTKQVLSIVRKQILELLENHRTPHKEYFDKCILCNVTLMPQELQEMQASSILDDVEASKSCIPHILGYFEVSSVTKYPPAMLSLTNKNLESLKSAIVSSNHLIANTEFGIPKTWISFYQKVLEKKMMPTAVVSEIFIVAEESEVHSDMVASMLRFFHSQGNFLWYEDIPEMRDVIITDPQWLSDQLRTLISYRPSVNAVCDGILYKPSLSSVWPEMIEENRQRLLALFRNVGLCFTISEDKEMFPCNLPIGWPDRHKWPPLPNKDECQTSLLVTFTFLPPAFFSKLIVEVNKKRSSFPSNVEPVYFRFHVLYVTNNHNKCDVHNHESKEDGEFNTTYHKVHYEIMPHNNTIKVSIRGPSPCCMVSGVCSSIEEVQSCHYPGVTFETLLICPLCEINKVDGPAVFSLTSAKHERICSRAWHDVGNINDILQGKYSSPETEETRKAVGDTLEDYHCPKLFVVLPINIKCSSLKNRIVYSYLKDGYAVHLLCECPDQWHFVDSPGFRIAKPKEFLEKYGKHLCTVMKVISKLGIPLRAAAAAEPLCKTGAAVASGASSIAKELEGFLQNVFEKYPRLKSASYRDLGDLKMPSGLQRSELARFLETVVKGREFGPLVFTYVDKCGEWLWLCEEHNRRFAIINK